MIRLHTLAVVLLKDFVQQIMSLVLGEGCARRGIKFRDLLSFIELQHGGPRYRVKLRLCLSSRRAENVCMHLNLYSEEAVCLR